MRSSIYEFVEEHGRTFHRYKEGSMIVLSSQTMIVMLTICDLKNTYFLMTRSEDPQELDFGIAKDGLDRTKQVGFATSDAPHNARWKVISRTYQTRFAGCARRWNRDW